VERQAPVRDVSYQHDGEGVAIDVAVVGQDATRRGDGQRRVLVGGVTVVARHGRVVDRVDLDGHGGGVAEVDGGVLGLVGEAVAAVVVRAVPVRGSSVLVERQAAVRGGRHQHGGEWVAIDVAVIGEDASRRGDGELGVLVGGVT